MTGLHRNNTHLNLADATGMIVIDPRVGALHEIDNQLFLGPPKTAESARTIALPPFLVELLRHHLAGHRHEQVFTARDGAFWRRSNFSRRAMRPAADGTTHRPRPAVVVPPAAAGLTFHGLRHSHKTWLIADQIPEVAQARRLGHRIPDKIQHVYSHVAPELEARLLDALAAALDRGPGRAGHHQLGHRRRRPPGAAGRHQPCGRGSAALPVRILTSTQPIRSPAGLRPAPPQSNAATRTPRT